MMGEREANQRHVIDRAILAIHDLGSRPGATKSSIISSLKKEGFSVNEITEAVNKMLGEKRD